MRASNEGTDLSAFYVNGHVSTYGVPMAGLKSPAGGELRPEGNARSFADYGPRGICRFRPAMDAYYVNAV